MFSVPRNSILIHKNVNFLGSQQLHKNKILWFCSSNNAVNFKKKDVSSESLQPKYSHRDAENGWYEWWEKQNYFKPHKSENESFVILFPPPNITGVLHLGHALSATIQDVIVRWKRMKGDSVLWVPGLDHAGIATQVAVEKYLKQTYNLTRNDIEKDEFVKKVWEWKKKNETNIFEQLKTLGCSFDWDKLKFTMDPVHSNIVTSSFVKLFNRGLIYHKESLVNWSCSIKSSISDIEINWIDITKKTKINVPDYEKSVEFGVMYNLAYKICDEDDEIIVSTTRPETILGDVAIAIHPKDPNLSKFKDKMVWHPFRHEKIPVIIDDFVDLNLGTGAVKITPAHSVTDFKVAEMHNLNVINVINEEGRLNEVGHYQKLFGLKRFDARNIILNELANLGLFRGAFEHATKIPLCSRSGDVIEQLLKKQWFLRIKSLAADAIELVESGALDISPENYVKVWREWLTNDRDWNLSRQLLWGHQIPMYECVTENKSIWVAAHNLEEAKKSAIKSLKCSKDNICITQDPDVLDTWFSSALLPLNTLSNSPLEKVPISLMVTGHDILFFWVARMVMLTRCLTGYLPFNKVLLHGLVCDAQGTKMSKSVGNVIQPEDIIKGRPLAEMKKDLEKNFKEKLISSKNFQLALEKQKKMFPKGIPECGVDALRLSLSAKNIQGPFINFDVDVCRANAAFCNKIWQAMNYHIKFVNDYKPSMTGNFDSIELENLDLNVFDKWILSKLAAVVDSAEKNLELLIFYLVVKNIKKFFVEDFCGVYLEISKLYLKEKSSDCPKIILIFHNIFETSLKLLSPFMPFVTEHLYHALPLWKDLKKSESITITEYPKSTYWTQYCNVELEKNMDKVLEVLSELRRVVINYQISKPKVFLKCTDDVGGIIFGHTAPALARLGKVGEIIRVNEHNGLNVIEEKISNDCVAFIEHNFDLQTLKKQLGSSIKKEEKLRATLAELSEERFKKKTQSEKFQFYRKLDEVKRSLKQIEQYKKTIENCSS